MLALPLTLPNSWGPFFVHPKGPLQHPRGVNMQPFFLGAPPIGRSCPSLPTRLYANSAPSAPRTWTEWGVFAVGAWGNPGCRKGYVCVCVIYTRVLYVSKKISGSFFENGKKKKSFSHTISFKLFELQGGDWTIVEKSVFVQEMHLQRLHVYTANPFISIGRAFWAGIYPSPNRQGGELVFPK